MSYVLRRTLYDFVIDLWAPTWVHPNCVQRSKAILDACRALCNLTILISDWKKNPLNLWQMKNGVYVLWQRAYDLFIFIIASFTIDREKKMRRPTKRKHAKCKYWIQFYKLNNIRRHLVNRSYSFAAYLCRCSSLSTFWLWL